MSRLTRDKTAEPVSRDQILRHARGQGNIIFPVQLTTSRIGNLTRLIHSLLHVMTIHTYIHTPTRAKKNKNITKQNRNDKKKGTKIKIHMPEKDRRRALDREFGIIPAASHPIPSPDRNHAPKRVASTTLRTLRVSVYSNGTVDVA